MERERSYKTVVFIGLLVLVLLSSQLFAAEPAAKPAVEPAAKPATEPAGRLSRSRRGGGGLYGDWDVKVESSRGQSNSILSFSRGAEGKQTGNWISLWGFGELKDVKFEEGKLSFTRESPGRDGQTRTSKFAGTIKDGKLAGTLTSERGESKVEGKRSGRTPRAVGNWELKLKMGEREFASTLVITAAKKEAKATAAGAARVEYVLSAEWKSERGEHKVSDVKYERGKLTFKRKSKMGDRQSDSTFEGTISGGTLSGAIKSERGEITVEGKLAGTALIGTWNLEIESERGKRKQRLKVNPDMSGLYGANAVKKVKLEGDKVSFKIVLEFGERKFEMDFAGKLKESKLTGEMTTSRGSQKVTGSKVVRRRGRRRSGSSSGQTRRSN